MDIDRIERIVVPHRGWRGLKPNHRGFPSGGYRCLAFDTETVDGWPYTLQVTDGEKTHLWYLQPKQFLPKLIEWLRPYVRDHSREVVLWGHFLGFDLPALLYPLSSKFADSNFGVGCRGVGCEIFYGKVPFAKFRFPSGRTVWIVDTFAFVWTSLKKASEVWGLPTQKLPRPKGLGKAVLRGPEFEAYAKADAVATHQLAERLVDLHKQWDVTLCVSIAQMSARIFSHHFLSTDLPPVPDRVAELALRSYHGGKNGLYVAPGWRWCREYDISSAYPWAMTKIPPLDEGKWERVRHVDGRDEGFYHISGRTRACRFPVLFSAGFLPITGRFDGVACTSYEVREAVGSGCVDLDRIDGYVWRGRGANRPLRDFARHFYRAKETSPPGPEREMFKLILNSLYGKFIQLTEMPDGTEKPGQYFHPVLASWITGCVRARMHRLERRADALHVATDALHTARTLPTGCGMGSLGLAQSWGPCLFLRNKFYFHYSGDGQTLKEAHHGVQAHPTTIWKMLVSGKRVYKVRRLLRPKEAIRLKTRPLQEVFRTHTINIGGVAVEPIPAPARRYWEAKSR